MECCLTESAQLLINFNKWREAKPNKKPLPKFEETSLLLSLQPVHFFGSRLARKESAAYSMAATAPASLEDGEPFLGGGLGGSIRV